MKQPNIFGKCFVHEWIFCGLLSLAILAFSSLAAAELSQESPVFDRIIENTARKYQIDPLLIRAMIWRESQFRPLSLGSKGEIGLMQIRLITVQDWANAHSCKMPETSELYDPVLNIEIGTWYLSKALQHWKGHPRQIQLALCEYNAGRRGLRKLLKANCNNCAKVCQTTAAGIYSNLIFHKYLDYRFAKLNQVYAFAAE